ncbi:hypothetical protein HMPREF3181_01301 [Parvimonas sp. KA00067]|nr:hypothetical protein HMPREF3181_01301 [Parvimonas sp. KA00067]
MRPETLSTSSFPLPTSSGLLNEASGRAPLRLFVSNKIYKFKSILSFLSIYTVDTTYQNI